MVIHPTLRIALLALLTLLLVGYALLAVGPTNPPPAPSAELLQSFVIPAPEPLDKFIYMGLTLALPLVLLAVAWAARRTDAQARQLFWVLCGILLTVVVWKGAIAHLAYFFRGWHSVATLAAVGAAIALVRRDLINERLMVWGGLAASALLLAGMRLWTAHGTNYASSTFTAHYEAVTSAAVRMAGGGTCLAEVIPQYGCHGEYIALVLQLLGSSVLAVTFVYLLLQVIAVGAVFHFARRIMRDRLLLLACLLCLVISVVLNPVPWVHDPILQYHPVRFFVPALSLLLLGWLQGRMSMKRMALAGAFAGFAITWNLETGVAVAIALGMFVMLARFETIAVSMKRAAVYALCAAAYIALFLFCLHIKSNGGVDLAGYILFQVTFYFTGFGMIAIPPLPDWWTLHAAAIVVPLIYVAMRVGRERQADAVLERIAYLAILAIGLTLYYSGRSHDLVLKLVAWPDILLFFFLADHALRNSRRDRVLKAALIALPAAFLIIQLPALWQIALQDRFGTANAVEQDAAFIRQHTTPGEAVTIFALNHGILQGESRTSSAMRGVGLAEMLRTADLQRAEDEMMERGPQKLFLGYGLGAIRGSGKLAADLPLDIDRLRTRYALVAWGPDMRLMYLHRKPYEGRDLFGTETPAIKAGDGADFAASWGRYGGPWGRPSANGFIIPGAQCDDSFALRLRFTPAATPAPNAHLVGNYRWDYQGFAIRRDPADAGKFIAMIGDGKRFRHSKPFTLPTGDETDLRVRYDRGTLKLYANGDLLLDEPGLGPILPSSMPLTVGAYYMPGGEFDGVIHEVRFFDDASKMR